MTKLFIKNASWDSEKLCLLFCDLFGEVEPQKGEEGFNSCVHLEIQIMLPEERQGPHTEEQESAGVWAGETVAAYCEELA